MIYADSLEGISDHGVGSLYDGYGKGKIVTILE
jgi:hypothetical protein